MLFSFTVSIVAPLLRLVHVLWLGGQGRPGPALSKGEIERHLVWKPFYLNWRTRAAGYRRATARTKGQTKRMEGYARGDANERSEIAVPTAWRRRKAPAIDASVSVIRSGRSGRDHLDRRHWQRASGGDKPARRPTALRLSDSALACPSMVPTRRRFGRGGAQHRIARPEHVGIPRIGSTCPGAPAHVARPSTIRRGRITSSSIPAADDPSWARFSGLGLSHRR